MRGLHDVHAGTVAMDLPVLTAHVVVDDSCFHDDHLPTRLDQTALPGRPFRRRALHLQFEPAAFRGA
jgi:cobalt-zinc-cadmium efflux system protein